MLPSKTIAGNYLQSLIRSHLIYEFELCRYVDFIFFLGKDFYSNFDFYNNMDKILWTTRRTAVINPINCEILRFLYQTFSNIQMS